MDIFQYNKNIFMDIIQGYNTIFIAFLVLFLCYNLGEIVPKEKN